MIENKSYEILTCKILEMSNFGRAILTRGSGDKAMPLYQYFQPLDGLPDPSGPLSASVSPVAIKDANMAVRNAKQAKKQTQARGHGNAQAHTKIKIRKFLLKALRPFL